MRLLTRELRPGAVVLTGRSSHGYTSRVITGLASTGTGGIWRTVEDTMDMTDAASPHVLLVRFTDGIRCLSFEDGIWQTREGTPL